MVLEDNHGHGLGIVPFDGHLRFGEHNPFSVEEARQRTSEWESTLARGGGVVERGRERGSGGVLGYPDSEALRAYPEVNLIPTRSNPDAMRAMVGEGERR